MPQPASIGEQYARAWRRFHERSLSDAPKFFLNTGDARELSTAIEEQRIAEIIQSHGIDLIKTHPGVVAIALSRRYADGQVVDVPTLTFYVEDEWAVNLIPPQIDGVSTDVVVAGNPVAHTAAAGHTPGLTTSPTEPGCSIAHVNKTSGTLGCLVQDDHDTYLLSCAHVLADVNPGTKGDAIVHPGPLHGGAAPGGTLACFDREIPTAPGNCIADAALAKLSAGASVTPVIRYVGVRPAGTVVLTRVGAGVKKSGDETGLTRGIVVGLKATVGPYTLNGVTGIYFTDVIVTSAMSRGGDSGALLLTNANEAVGLLFGGLEYPDPATGNLVPVVTWYSPIDPVLNNLGVTLV